MTEQLPVEALEKTAENLQQGRTTEVAANDTPIKAVIFDLDNTLMDRDHAFRAFSERLVRDYLGHVDETLARDIIGYLRITDADGYRDKRGFFEELTERLPWAEKPEVDELFAYDNEHYMLEARLMKHAREAIAACREQGFRLGILTNGTYDIQYGKVRHLELEGDFDVILTSGEAGIKKPDARIYEMILERLGTSGAETVFVGDHPVNDIWGAAQSGMRGIFLRRSFAWDDELGMKPWRTIDDLDELEAIWDMNK
ncbi:HAD family hydrolase [Paenibacillus hunanensis]|uniref:Hydrolase of the HAD superfamily n=2 Tax=Paenibacillus hunanensis TaxID=539262 RepID=A0ABU1IZF4_9BACL|nr:HAD family hydrolase [Paenibacillus hunanensis]MDR6244611.1 putative hydrolase of the HAD superfamily [Paenibacillus hunanensis]GGJ22953.1 haloacid dehalogenase [Paenibacillus hunanensis]